MVIASSIGLPFTLFIALCYTLTCISQSHLLYKSLYLRVGEKLSPSILINIAIWSMVSFLCAFLYIVNLFFAPSQLHPLITQVLYYFNIEMVCLTGVIPLSISFLLLDRILILKSPITHRKRRKLYTLLTILLCFFGNLIYLICYNLTFSLALSIGRLFFGFINFILGCVLLKFVYGYSNKFRAYRQFRMANTVTITGASTELFCNFIPNLCVFIYASILGNNIKDFLIYPIILIALDALTTSFVYRFVITKRKKKVSNVHIINIMRNANQKSTLVINNPIKVH